jgi:nucleoside-diphosphate-sugar epimerase
MKIAIIGCGYVGQSVARFWKEKGHFLTVTTTTPEQKTILENIANQVIVMKGNNLESVNQVCENQEVILFCVGAKNRTGYKETYLETAQNLTQVLANNSTVKQLIYTGSYSILGDQKGLWTDETAIPNPTNETGQILLETEQVLLAQNNPNVKTCILRLGGIYGPGRTILRIFQSWAGTTQNGNGEDYSNWTHLDDIVNGLEFARSEQLEGIYNLVHDHPMKRKELLEKLFTIHNLPPVKWSISGGQTYPYNTRLSNQKIKDQGYQFIHPEIRLELT